MTLHTLLRVPLLDDFLHTCADLRLDVRLGTVDEAAGVATMVGPAGETITVRLESARAPLEQLLQGLHFDFEALPLLVRGESKEIRLLTPNVCLARLLPTAYSYTNNRYGVVPGTDHVRARFSAEIFRAMQADPLIGPGAVAFLGLVESPHGPLIAERVVTTCNLEVRVKRYHIGSPTKRYRFVDQHATAHGGPPLQRWDRFGQPVVCFDWRHPLRGDDGERLADEPLSDDYAALWIDDMASAKHLARRAFSWMEALFAGRGLRLIDICYFIDRPGTTIFGEISPDCMRVRSSASDDAEALDKDEWRSGGDADQVLNRYQRLYTIMFDAQANPSKGRPSWNRE